MAVYSRVCWQDAAVRHQPAFQSRLYQTSYCWDVRDVVDIREIRKGWRRRGFQLLDLLFPWQQEPHRGGFFLHRLEKPFSNRRNIQSGSGRAGLTAVCARCCSCACVCLSFIFMFLFCTHRLKNDTTENTSEGNHNLCVTVHYIFRERKKKDKIWALMVLILVVFQGNPLLPPNHRSVSLETKRWHVETMECFCCKKKKYQRDWESPTASAEAGDSISDKQHLFFPSFHRGRTFRDRRGEGNPEKRLSQGPSRLGEFHRDIFKAVLGFLRVHTPSQGCLTELETLCHSKNGFLHVFECNISILPLSYSLYLTKISSLSFWFDKPPHLFNILL